MGATCSFPGSHSVNEQWPYEQVIEESYRVGPKAPAHADAAGSGSGGQHDAPRYSGRHPSNGITNEAARASYFGAESTKLAPTLLSSSDRCCAAGVDSREIWHCGQTDRHTRLTATLDKLAGPTEVMVSLNIVQNIVSICEYTENKCSSIIIDEVASKISHFSNITEQVAALESTDQMVLGRCLLQLLDAIDSNKTANRSTGYEEPSKTNQDDVLVLVFAEALHCALKRPDSELPLAYLRKFAKVEGEERLQILLSRKLSESTANVVKCAHLHAPLTNAGISSPTTFGVQMTGTKISTQEYE